MIDSTPSDFQQLGLGSAPLRVGERVAIVSIDYEAFPLGRMHLWFAAMDGFTRALERSRLPVSVFLSIEDIVRLRLVEPDSYRTLITYLRRWWQAGSRFYPHNHYAFDPATGDYTAPAADADDAGGDDYAKRKSFFHHAVRQSGLDLADWLVEVYRIYDAIMTDIAERPVPTRVFRAGGWDYGSGRDDLQAYLDALRAAGVAIDSSACRGRFGTTSWRVGMGFGHNLFHLEGGILEAAPTWSVDMDGDPLRPRRLLRLAAATRRYGAPRGGNGLLNLVLHFDHLLHDWNGDVVRYFAAADERAIAARAGRWARTFALLLRALRARPITFDDLPCLLSG